MTAADEGEIEWMGSITKLFGWVCARRTGGSGLKVALAEIRQLSLSATLTTRASLALVLMDHIVRPRYKIRRKNTLITRAHIRKNTLLTRAHIRRGLF